MCLCSPFKFEPHFFTFLNSIVFPSGVGRRPRVHVRDRGAVPREVAAPEEPSLQGAPQRDMLLQEGRRRQGHLVTATGVLLTRGCVKVT